MSIIVDFIRSIIVFLYNITVTIGIPSYALAIIMISILVKILLYPLMAKQMRSTMNMQEVQPKMEALQKKYKNSPEKMNEELMKLYKEYDINPMAGCLPLIIQMPILIGLFTALREFTFDPAEHATFFWIANLNDKDPLFILPILVGVSMYFTQKISMGANSAVNENQMMKTMMYVMPPMMTFMAISMPSGLCLYWVFFSLLSIVQQYFMNKQRAKQKAEREARQAAEKEAAMAARKASKAASLEKNGKKKKKASSAPSKEEETIVDAVVKEEE